MKKLFATSNRDRKSEAKTRSRQSLRNRTPARIWSTPVYHPPRKAEGPLWVQKFALVVRINPTPRCRYSCQRSVDMKFSEYYWRRHRKIWIALRQEGPVRFNYASKLDERLLAMQLDTRTRTTFKRLMVAREQLITFPSSDRRWMPIKQVETSAVWSQLCEQSSAYVTKLLRDRLRRTVLTRSHPEALFDRISKDYERCVVQLATRVF